MNQHKAFLTIGGNSRIELKRGDKIGHRGTSSNMTFAYVTDDGKIATQEPGENCKVQVPAEFNGIYVEMEQKELPHKYTHYSATGSRVSNFASMAFMEQSKNIIKQDGGGWIEDDTGQVIHGKKPAGTIDLTPTWRSILPVLIEGIINGTDKGRSIAREELERMANAADAYNKQASK